MKRFIFGLAVLFAFIFFSCSHSEEEKRISSLDFQPDLEKLKDNSLPSDEKQKLTNEILSKADKSAMDSVRMKVLASVTKIYLKQGDSLNFRILNQKRKNLALALKDSTALASANWDLGFFLYNKTDYIDSAYYYYNEAEKLYESAKDNYNAARVLLNISTIQQDIKDYLGSEASVYKAIEFLQKAENNPYQLYKAYNNLGVALKELGDFDKSLSFFEQAGKHLDEKKYKIEQLILWNNIGSILAEKKEYKKAESFLEKALYETENLKTENPSFYIVLLVNLGQNRLEYGDSENVKSWLDQAMKVAEETDNPNGIALCNLGLSDFYLSKKDTILAKKYAEKAKSLSQIRQDNRLHLQTLKRLIQIDKENSSQHAQEYIQLNDSLQQRDRLTQNKFAGIRYETNTYKTQSKMLSNWLSLITAVASGILVTLGLLFIIFRQRSRNKELVLIQQKHEADEQVYKLVLKQQKKFEEGRIAEKKRIARELHDGILGKLFGLQLNLEILNQKNDADSQEKRFEYIDQLRGISQEIRTLSHDLDRVDFNQTDFPSILEDYVKKQNSKKIRFDVNIDRNIAFETFDTDVRVNLFRIIQEGIQNIHKHSEADHAEINLDKEDQFIELIIKDNGKGTDPKKKKSGLGLKNMKSRAQEMNAKLQITFAENTGGGTKILLKIPIDE